MSVIQSAAVIWGIKETDINGFRRTRNIADARMAVALVYRRQGWPDGATARLINRTRSAVNYAIHSAKEALETNPEFRSNFDRLLQLQEKP